MLTTGLLKEALGFRERSAVKRLGLPSHWVDHGGSIAAFRHMLEMPCLPPGDGADLAEQRNTTAVAAFNRAQQQHAAAAADPGDADVSHREAACVRACHGGLASICSAWGNAQEAAALYSLLEAFPGSAVQEVGLCIVDPAEVQRRYGIAPADLPPLGASPDGWIQHQVDGAAAACSAEHCTLRPAVPPASDPEIEALLSSFPRAVRPLDPQLATLFAPATDVCRAAAGIQSHRPPVRVCIQLALGVHLLLGHPGCDAHRGLEPMHIQPVEVRRRSDSEPEPRRPVWRSPAPTRQAPAPAGAR